MKTSGIAAPVGRIGGATGEMVTLVNDRDEPVGMADKLAAHQDGRLHRAVSVFLFNATGEVLLQRRADSKYHSPGRWSNTACGHPRPGEAPEDAARRRLRDELGIVCGVWPLTVVRYRADVEGGLVEHEIDHVFVGLFEGIAHPRPAEVSECRWIRVTALLEDCQANPDRYTAWLPILLDRIAGGPAAVAGAVGR